MCSEHYRIKYNYASEDIVDEFPRSNVKTQLCSEIVNKRQLRLLCYPSQKPDFLCGDISGYYHPLNFSPAGPYLFLLFRVLFCLILIISDRIESNTFNLKDNLIIIVIISRRMSL